MRDVARRAGVSVAVVSAVISGGSSNIRVGEATRERVLEAVRESGYRRNEAARALRSSSSGFVSVVIPRVSNPVMATALNGMHELAQDEDLVLVLTDTEWIVADGRVSNLMRRLSGTGLIDGFIIRTTSPEDEAVTDLLTRGVPLVILHEPFPGHDHVCVWVDDEAGVYTAADYLLRLGHRHIAMVGGPQAANSGVTGRSRGFSRALADHGVSEPAQIQAVGYQERSVAKAVADLYRGRTGPTGLVIDNGVAAPAAIAALTDLGLRVPDDVSVIGYHDIPAANVMRPSLSTVRMPVKEAGRLALQTLLKLVRGEPAASVVISDPPPEVLPRQTTTGPSGRR